MKRLRKTALGSAILAFGFLPILISPQIVQAQDAPPPAAQQQPATAEPPAHEASAQSGPVVRSETRLVRVDVIVTDKKGNYIHDLTANDFKVYDDDKQQQVENFSFGADPSSPAAGERRWLKGLYLDEPVEWDYPYRFFRW